MLIEQREGIAMLEYLRRLIDQRVVGRDVERLRAVLHLEALGIRGHKSGCDATRLARAMRR